MLLWLLVALIMFDIDTDIEWWLILILILNGVWYWIMLLWLLLNFITFDIDIDIDNCYDIE